jgi:hypothetical protein
MAGMSPARGVHDTWLVRTRGSHVPDQRLIAAVGIALDDAMEAGKMLARSFALAVGADQCRTSGGWVGT